MEQQNNLKIVLGFVGKMYAGKGVATSYLKENHGFYFSSCSDRIREEIRSQGKEITRENLQMTAGNLRQEFGPAVLAERTWEQVVNSKAEKAVIDSIRGKEEAEFFKEKPGFILVAVLADPKTRFKRIAIQKRETDDPITWEDFLKTEERDANQEGRNIDACIDLSDFQIENNGSIEKFHQKIEELLVKINA